MMNGHRRSSTDLSLVVTETDGVLGLVKDRLAGTAVALVVMHTLTFVEGLLCARLLIVGLEATGDTVTNISGALLHLLLSGLGGVRGELLLGLGAEVLASGVRHVCEWFGKR